MKKNIRYNIVLLLLMVEAVLIPAFAQMPEIKLGQSISFEEYLNRVAKKNLSYLAEKLNVSIADAEVIARKIFPDPELEFEAGNETFSLGVSYSLEMGNKGEHVLSWRGLRQNWRNCSCNRAFRI